MPWGSKKQIILPFEYVHNTIVIRLSLNGAPPANFVFDTGTDTTILSRQAVEDGHLKTLSVDNKAETPGGGCPVSEVAQGVHIKTEKGDELLRGSVPIMDFSRIEKVLGIPVAGIFGFGYLRQFPVLLDYGAKTVTIFADKKVRYRGTGIAIPIVYTNISGGLPHLPVVPAVLNLPDGSSEEARLGIDTGSDGALDLHAPFVRRHHVVQRETKAGQKPARFFTQDFCGEKFEEVDADIAAIRLGGLNFATPGARYALDPVGESASDETDGRLGNRFLSQFRIFFDIPRRVIVFEQSLNR